MRRLELVTGLALVGLVVALAAVSLVWTPTDPAHIVPGDRLLPPGGSHLLGTDGFGRDVLSRLLVGARSCLTVGIISVGIAALVGVPLGMLAAQAPRTAAEALMRATDVAQAFPALLLAILLACVFGGSTTIAPTSTDANWSPSTVTRDREAFRRPWRSIAAPRVQPIARAVR